MHMQAVAGKALAALCALRDPAFPEDLQWSMEDLADTLQELRKRDPQSLHVGLDPWWQRA